MTRVEREGMERNAAFRRIRRNFRRDVVEVREAYRTKTKNEPVGEATLTCGHTALVSMKRRAVWRICWTCWKLGRATFSVPSADEVPRG